MKWRKLGLIYCPSGKHGWDKYSAMTPTPVILDNETIRVYVSFRDDEGKGRIGFVDVKADNPSIVLNVSKKPVLDVGVSGAFDDNGVILGDIIKHKNQIRMYYVGFQLVKKAKFLAFSGLAISYNEGKTFERISNAPILDRYKDEIYIRAIHCVRFEEGIWKVWYAAGNSWEYINGKPYPRYDIRYIESPDGINFYNNTSTVCISPERDEYRIGRPRVYKFNDKYYMFYTKGTKKGDYLAGYAESVDGKKWVRKDDEIGIGLSKDGWDSKMLCYPSLLQHKDKVYMFYNGNDMGKTGFGYAILEKWRG